MQTMLKTMSQITQILERKNVVLAVVIVIAVVNVVAIVIILKSSKKFGDKRTNVV